jgi:uncharacterized protein (DUF2252 family)
MSGKSPRTPKADDRAPVLALRRNLKMARSPHAYVRGNTLKFYEWLEAGGHSLPDGPPVWICGDCHLGNLGPLADANGRVDIQIRDLDQTVIGNPAHDLIRLALSLATAARGSALPGVTTAHMIEEMIAGYAHALDDPADKASVNEAMPETVRTVIAQSLGRRWKHLARERIADVSPVIPLGKRFWPLLPAEKTEIQTLFEQPEMRSMAAGLVRRGDRGELKIHDAAYWMKGCSSLGRLRFAVLLEISRRGRRHWGLVDIKEAAQSAAPRTKDAAMPRDNAERVVTGARAIAPFLGERMRAARLLGRSVVVRELLPQDLKLQMDELSRDEATKAARFLAGVVGRAHGRQMDDATRRGWRGEVTRSRSKTLDAPSWLWSSVVDLVAAHESAYLEHCRKYALDVAA